MWDQVSREIESSGRSIAVISSELLWPCTEEEISYLSRSLSQHETKAIIFFREPFSYSVSSYKQRVKMDYRYSLRTHMQEQVWRYDYTGIVRRWKKQISIVEMNYDSVKQNLFAAFSQQIGVELQGQRSDRLNVSPNDQAIMAARWINLFASKYPKLRHRIQRQIFRQTVVGKILSFPFSFRKLNNRSNQQYFEKLLESHL